MTPRPDIPVIETQRLRLRAPVLADFEHYVAFFASDRSVYEDGPMDRAGAWRVFAADAALWMFRGYGSFSIEDRATGAYLGAAGIYQQGHYPEPEIGWMLVREAEGKGIAHEAALAIRDWARRVHGLDGLVSYIDPGNVRSIRLAEKLGAVRDTGAALPSGEDCVVYRHPALGRAA